MKILNYLVVAAAVLMTAACGPKEFNLSTKTAKVDIPDTGATDSLVVNGSDGNCEIEFAPAWVEATVRDSVVTLKAAANTTGKTRQDVVVVKCGKSQLSVPVSQYVKATKLELPNGKEVKIAREGGSQDLAVVCDGLVTVEAFDPVTATWENGVLKVSAPKNDGHRIKGDVKLTAGELSEVVSVTVDGEVCPTCNGTGKVRCKACGGQGYNFRFDPAPGLYGCHACGGRGYAYRVADASYREGSGKVTCPTCKGKG